MRKTISILLSIVLVITCFSVAAVATSEDYTDVSPVKWYAPYVNVVTDKGLMSGMTSSTFDPAGKVTRAQVVQTLYALAGKPVVTADGQFSDLTAKWYQDSVNWAGALGVASGYADGSFKPNNQVKRQEIATFFKAYAEKIEKKDTSAVADLSGYSDYSKVSNYAKTPVAWAVRSGLMDSAVSGKKVLDPQGLVTRAQLATILCGYIGEKPAPAPTEIGSGKMYLVNESGTTEDMDAIIIYAKEDLVLTQIGLEAWDFDGSKISFIYVDDVLNEKEQLGNTQTSITLTGNMLKVGTHVVKVLQYDNNDPSGKIVTVKSAKYTIVRM